MSAPWFRVHGEDYLLAISLGLALAASLRLGGWKHWDRVLWLAVAMLFPVFALLWRECPLLILLPVFAVRVKTMRWGWGVLLVASLWPWLSRQRRTTMAAVGACWALVGLHSLARQELLLPKELAPPPGYQLVERVNYSDQERLLTASPVGFARFRSPDRATPKARVLDALADRLGRAGWILRERVEGAAAVSASLAYGDSMNDGDCHSADEADVFFVRLARFWDTVDLAWRREMWTDGGLAHLWFARESRDGEERMEHRFVFVYDLPDGRCVDVGTFRRPWHWRPGAPR